MADSPFFLGKYIAFRIRGAGVEVDGDDDEDDEEVMMGRRSHLMMEPSLLEVYSQDPSSVATAAVTGPR